MNDCTERHINRCLKLTARWLSHIQCIKYTNMYLLLHNLWSTYDKTRCLCRQCHRSPCNHRLKAPIPVLYVRPLVHAMLSPSLFPKCLLRLGVVLLFWVLVFYEPFCHGAFKLVISTLFTKNILWTSLQILRLFVIFGIFIT